MSEQPEKNNPPIWFLTLGIIFVVCVVLWVFDVFSHQYTYDNRYALKNADGHEIVANNPAQPQQIIHRK
jgi:hypothetical protein